MLPETDRRVVQFFDEMKRKRRKMSDSDIIGSIRTGESWPKCWAKHAEEKTRLEKEMGKKVPGII